MNIQTESLAAVLEQYEAHHRNKIPSAKSEVDKAFLEGLSEALRQVRKQIIPSLENEFKDIVQETEERTISHSDLQDSEQRVLSWLRYGPPQEGEEWKL